MLGSLFFGLARGAVRCRVLFMVRELCVIVSLLLCTAARATTASRCPSRRGAEAAPHGFLRARFRPRRVIGTPPPRRSGSHAGRVCRPESQTADAKCCIGHCDGASRCPAGAQSTRVTSLINCCETLRSEGSATTTSHEATLPCGAALHNSRRPRPKGRQHLPDALPAEGRRLCFIRGRHGGALLR